MSECEKEEQYTDRLTLNKKKGRKKSWHKQRLHLFRHTDRHSARQTGQWGHRLLQHLYLRKVVLFLSERPPPRVSALLEKKKSQLKHKHTH